VRLYEHGTDVGISDIPTRPTFLRRRNPPERKGLAAGHSGSVRARRFTANATAIAVWSMKSMKRTCGRVEAHATAARPAPYQTLPSW
jgi:hypothetical protein